jgi:hypothetical protein
MVVILVLRAVQIKKPTRWVQYLSLWFQSMQHKKTKMMSCAHRLGLKGWAIEKTPRRQVQLIVVVSELATLQKRTIHRLGFECSYNEKNPGQRAIAHCPSFGSKKENTYFQSEGSFWYFMSQAPQALQAPQAWHGLHKLHKLFVKFFVVLKL